MTAPRHVRIGALEIGNDRPLALIAGPCAMESRSHALEMSAALKEMADRVGVGLIYKTSFDKANRTALDSPRGLGLEQALSIFAEVRETTGCPVLTDVHTEAQCADGGATVRSFCTLETPGSSNASCSATLRA